MDDFDEEERDHLAMLAYQRKMRREEIARDLLLKLVESTPGASKYDTKFNVAKAIEYTDALLAKLEEPCDPTK